MLGLIFLFFCLTVCASLSANIWLSKWTDSANITSGIYYMNIYSALGITQGRTNLPYVRFSLVTLSDRFTDLCHAVAT